MADLSRPLHRNHTSSAILSKKLSNVHSFSGKSVYDDVFATTPSKKLKAPTFSARVEDYSEIFNSSNSSIPVLDLPAAVDKRDGLAGAPSSESDYSKIFGGFNDIDIDFNEDCSPGEARIPAETRSLSESDADFVEKNQVPSQDATCQPVDGKKEFKMSYNITNVGIKDGANGTTLIAQLHAVPGFTCVIDGITPLQSTDDNKPVPSINDVSPVVDINEGFMEGKHCSKASSNLPDSGSKDGPFEFDHNKSSSNSMQFNANDIDVNAHHPKVMPFLSPTPNLGNNNSSSKKATAAKNGTCTREEFDVNAHHPEVMPFSSPTPNLGNNNSSSKKATAAKNGTCMSEEFESATDETPVFSDDDVDTNSAAAASAAAVRKAIETAQASIRLAKEAMERKKGLQSSVKHSSKKGLKVKEVREIKIAAEAKRLKKKKGQEISEREKSTIQNFPCTDGQNARTGQVAPNFNDWKNKVPSQGAARETNRKQSEVLLVMQNKQQGQGEFETARLSCDFINTGKYGETTPLFEEEDIKEELTQTVDKSDREKRKTSVDTFELTDSDGKISEMVEEEQTGRKLNASKEGAQELEHHCNKLTSSENLHEHKELEKKLEVAHKKLETEGKLKASQEQERCEEELTESQEPLENENESTTKMWEQEDYEEGLKESQELETEMKLKQARESNFEKRLKEDSEREEERRLKELLEQEIYERSLEEACECLEDEKKPTVSCEWEVNKKSLKHVDIGQDYESGLKTVQDQEIRVDDLHGGKASENRLKEDFEREEYDKLGEAWKQEENESILEEAGPKEGNERKEGEAYEWEGSNQRHPYQREEYEKNIKATEESLTNMEKIDQKTCDSCKQPKSENLSGAGETYRDKGYIDNVEATQDVLAHEESSRMVEATKASSEPEENEEGLNAVEVDDVADKEVFGKACLDRDAIDGDDHQIENSMDDVAEAFIINDDKVNEVKENDNELKTVDVTNELEEKEMLETASVAEDELEQYNIENSIKDERDSFLVDDLSLGETNMNTEHEQTNQNDNESRFACHVGAHVEKLNHELGETGKNTEEAEVANDQVEVTNQIKASYLDNHLDMNEKKMEASELNSVHEREGKFLEASQEIKSSQNTEQMEDLNKTWIMEEREAKESMQKDVMLEKEHLKSRMEAKEKERERDRLAVERVIREARERAFAEARERAEKAAMEKATAEARQREKTDVRERLDKAAAGANSLPAKVSMEAKLKAERAAVERATAEARERALEKALSEKAAFEAREQRNNGGRHTFSSSDQYQGSGLSSGFKHSNSSDFGVPSATERSDDGARTESAERCKARLEKHQQIVERAAKALEEKNKRDLLVQKEQAERNRFAEALDADVKRWSSGKAGNLRALLSTLQYILGPNSGWQPIPLTDIVASSAVKKAYRKATLFVHPDKLQQRGASIQQKYICEKVFDLLKEAWNKFSSEER